MGAAGFESGLGPDPGSELLPGRFLTPEGAWDNTAAFTPEVFLLWRGTQLKWQTVFRWCGPAVRGAAAR